MEFSESEPFKKEFKKLHKKYPTLVEDLAVVKKAIATSPTGNGTKHWNILASDAGRERHIIKMRMMCRSVRGAQFRLVYFYDETAVGKEETDILFIEVYFKGNKQSENTKRIQLFIEDLVQKKRWQKVI